ncbi:MAG: hypothetical protein PHX83_09560 [Acidobacteriia bacterium]|nr:hypothetical protein [Terriglobia bacterium]
MEHSTSGSVPLLIALHGYAGNKESMMSIAQRINSRDVIIASLQGPYQFSYPYGLKGFEVGQSGEIRIGFAWATRWKDRESIELHHRNVLSLIDEVAQAWPVDRSKVFLLGFSQPVALNYRFVFTYPDVIRGVIGVCGGVPGDWDTFSYKTSQTDVLHIAGENDPFYSVERSEKFEGMLRQRAANVEFCLYNESHRFPRRAIPLIGRWLKARI